MQISTVIDIAALRKGDRLLQQICALFVTGTGDRYLLSLRNLANEKLAEAKLNKDKIGVAYCGGLEKEYSATLAAFDLALKEARTLVINPSLPQNLTDRYGKVNLPLVTPCAERMKDIVTRLCNIATAIARLGFEGPDEEWAIAAGPVFKQISNEPSAPADAGGIHEILGRLTQAGYSLTPQTGGNRIKGLSAGD